MMFLKLYFGTKSLILAEVEMVGLKSNGIAPSRHLHESGDLFKEYIIS
jgi:hypothetical protein